MFDLFALVRSESTGKAFSAWETLLGEAGDRVVVSNKLEPVVIRGILGAEQISNQFRRIVHQLSSVADGTSSALVDSRRLMIWVDTVNASELKANGMGWNGLVAALILAFPDAHWVFGHVSHHDNDGPPPWLVRHGFLSLWRGEVYDPLFDPSGLRDWVRVKTRTSVGCHGKLLPNREKVSAVLEEEPGYAYLHAYTAYRFGSRTEVVLSKRQMTALFGKCQSEKQKGHGYWLLLEDMSLKYPDKEANEHWLDLNDRAKQFEKLAVHTVCEDSSYRTLITSGQTGAQKTVLEGNREYLQKKYLPWRVPENVILFKPANGMFELWHHIFVPVERSFCEGYEIPWGAGTDMSSGPEKGLSKDHGAPGRLLMIADALTSRVRAREVEVNTVQGAVRSGVMATDAVELIGYQTPSTAFDAIYLKHRCEILAECLFLGTEHHSKLDERFEEIDQQVECASWNYEGKSRQRTVADNVRLTIYSGLAKLFSDHGQFDEELKCINKARKHHIALGLSKSNTLWMGGISRSLPNWLIGLVRKLLESSRNFTFALFALLAVIFRWPINWVLLATGKVLESGANFAMAALLPLLFLTGFFWGLSGIPSDDAQSKPDVESSFGCSVQAAFRILLSGGKPEGFSERCAEFQPLVVGHGVFEFIVGLFSLYGYFLFAMLLAHLYLYISRR